MPLPVSPFNLPKSYPLESSESLSFYSFGEWTAVEELEPVFDGVHQGASDRFKRPRSVSDFRAALQELDGGFLRYGSGHVSFLNPSVRDFTAGVFCENPALALYVFADAVRFRQLVNLWKLAREPLGGALLSLILGNPGVLCEHAARLMKGESMRWKSAPKGKIGYAIDTGEESRLSAIVEWCEATKSSSFVDLARECVSWLLNHWATHTPDFRASIDALDAISSAEWFMTKGGAEVYRAVLNGVLSNVRGAWAYDWSHLLELPEQAIGWSEGDQSRLDVGLSYYLLDGVRSEQDSCNDSSEMNDLVDSLTRLKDDYGLALNVAIESLQESLRELEEREDWRDGGGGGLSHRSGAASSDSMNDDDVRGMFRGLAS